MRLPVFTSVLAPTLRSLAEHRQALGYRDYTLRSHLAHFDRYLVTHGWTFPYLTREVVEGWVASDAALQPRSRAKRLDVMRLLGRFIAQTRPETYIPGPAWAWSRSSGFRPYIYTPAEIKALLAEARRLTPVGSLCPYTYATLFGLLYCTGLRISEAIAYAGSNALIPRSAPSSCSSHAALGSEGQLAPVAPEFTTYVTPSRSIASSNGTATAA